MYMVQDHCHCEQISKQLRRYCKEKQWWKFLMIKQLINYSVLLYCKSDSVIRVIVILSMSLRINMFFEAPKRYVIFFPRFSSFNSNTYTVNSVITLKYTVLFLGRNQLSSDYYSKVLFIFLDIFINWLQKSLCIKHFIFNWISLCREWIGSNN